MQDGKFHHFIIITIMVPFEHDYVLRRENGSGSPPRRYRYPHATCALTRDRRVHLGVVVADAKRGRSAGAIQVPTTRRVLQIASLAAGDSWERIESPAEGAPCAYGGWGWRADGG